MCLKIPANIDFAILVFTKIIKMFTLDLSSPSNTPHNSNSLPEHLSLLLTEKCRFKNHWQSSHFQSDKRYYNNIFCSLKNLLHKYNTEKFQHVINSLTNSNNSL